MYRRPTPKLKIDFKVDFLRKLENFLNNEGVF